MLYSVLRLAGLAALAVAVPVPPAALTPAAGSAARLPEQRLNMEEAGAAFSQAQADFNTHLEDFKQDVLDALDPAGVDPAKVTDLIVAHPFVGAEHQEAIGAAVDELHSHLTNLHGSGFVEPGEGRWALGLQDFINQAVSWFTNHIEDPLSSAIDDFSEEQLGSDVSYVVPAFKSMVEYLADLLGSLVIFLDSPSFDSALDAFLDASSGEQPDTMGFIQQAMVSSGCV
jgi:hypothetical protein